MMGKYVLVFKARDLSFSEASRLQAESTIRANRIAPAKRNVVGIERKNKGGKKK